MSSLEVSIMNATRFVSILYLIGLSIGLIGQELPLQRAQKDQMASKVWRALGEALNNASECNPQPVIDKLAAEFQLPKDHIRKFLSYTLNYSSENLNTEQISYRYPHYNEDSTRGDFIFLTEAGLLKRNAIGWNITSNGETLINKYWEIKLADVSTCENGQEERLKALTLTSERLISAYANNEIFKSVKLRIANRRDSFSEYPLLLLANEYQKDLTAIFNDNGHYRIDYLIASNENQKWQDISLSALAKELLGATRNGRIYQVTRCADQPNWRVGKVGCDLAISELLDHDLIKLENGNISQTTRGNELFNAAEVLADRRLYNVWDILSIEEYEELLKVLEGW